jgi:hypothetical protein
MMYLAIIVLATFFASLLFVILYGFFSGWFLNRMGRHLMWFSSVVTLTYLNSSVRLFFPGLPYRAETSYVLLTLVFLVVCQRTWIMIRVMVQDRKDLKEAQQHESE